MKDPLAVWFIIAGLVFTVVGIVCSIAALVRDLREYGPRPTWPLAARFGGWLLRPFRRRRVGLRSTNQPATARVVGSGSLTVGPAVAGADATVEEQLALLTKRVEQVEERAEAERQRLTKIADALRGELYETNQRLGAATRRLEDLAHSVAVGTAKLQLWGILAVAVGTLLMAVPSLLAAI